ncbi:MAG: hypothetical protein AB7U29_10030, partial [Desulfobulbus sp.]
EIFTHVGGHAQNGTCQPEDLLVGIENEGVQNYIVELLTALPPLTEEDEPKPGHRMIDELLNWLRIERQRRDGACLQQRIAEAERSGNIVLLMELLGEKQALERKRQSF